MKRTALLLTGTLLLAACAARPAADAAPPPANLAPQPPAEQAPTAGAVPAPLAGLVFSAGGSLWQITAAGSITNLATCAEGSALSLETHQMLYTSEDFDIYLLDLATCTRQNLTNTPDTVELNPRWWPGLPGAALIGVNPEFDAGKPALLQIGRTDYQIIDYDFTANDLPAIRPDGQLLAYPAGFGSQAAVFSLTEGRQILDLGAFGIEPTLLQRLDSPAWSPDGRKLAWVAATQQGEDYTTRRIELLILDLDARSALRLHPYVPLGRGGWPPAAVWSPDGRWLAFNPWPEDPTQSALWVVAADGSAEVYLDVPNPQGNWLSQNTPPIWSPDSSRLAFSLIDTEPGLWWVEVGTWQPEPLALPEDALLLVWP